MLVYLYSRKFLRQKTPLLLEVAKKRIIIRQAVCKHLKSTYQFLCYVANTTSGTTSHKKLFCYGSHHVLFFQWSISYVSGDRWLFFLFVPLLIRRRLLLLPQLLSVQAGVKFKIRYIGWEKWGSTCLMEYACFPILSLTLLEYFQPFHCFNML